VPGWAVGVTGQVRTQQLLEANRTLIVESAGIADLCFSLRRIMLGEDYQAVKDQAGAKSWGQSFLAAHVVRGIYSIGPDLGWTEIGLGTVWAEGSGAEFAIGAGTALGHAVAEVLEPYDMVRISLEVAMICDVYSGGSPWVGSLA
jgi:hypothetical protein